MYIKTEKPIYPNVPSNFIYFLLLKSSLLL